MTTVIEVVTVRKKSLGVFVWTSPRKAATKEVKDLIAEIESSNYDATILASKNIAVKIIRGRGKDSVNDWLNSTKYGKLLLALIGRKSTGIGIFVV